MSETADFDDIRPYCDAEVRPTIERLIADNEFVDAIAKLKMPTLSRLAAPLMRIGVRKALRKEVAGVTEVLEFQKRIEPYLKNLLDRTTTELTVSGLDNLNKQRAHLFISNHRDIAMDPAMVNWTLYQNQFQTLRVAIGDNLLTKPFASDLMRLNKCFIVNRSAKAPREKLKAAKHLSAYIRHSLLEDDANIWIAQREGRAKDSLDITNPAILSMIALCKERGEGFGEYIARLNVVPISISYEWDPCDVDKARELTLKAQDGEYKKSEHEDVQSIAKGIVGGKGRVHLAFGRPMPSELESPEQAAEYLDRVILQDYVLQPSHCAAYEMIEGKAPDLPVTGAAIPYSNWSDQSARETLKARLNTCDSQWQETLLRNYANPVYAKLAQANKLEQ